jgi:hypothetical protein
VIAAVNKQVIEARLKVKWEGMKTALMAGNIEEGLKYFIAGTQDRYRGVFSQMNSEKISRIFSGITEIQLKRISDDRAMCGAIRVESGGTYSYPVQFVKDQDGVWRIYGF